MKISENAVEPFEDEKASKKIVKKMWARLGVSRDVYWVDLENLITSISVVVTDCELTTYQQLSENRLRISSEKCMDRAEKDVLLVGTCD